MMSDVACFHLPGLFEFYDFYHVFLDLYYSHPEYFYDWCRIVSIYGAPGDCLWGGGRVGYGDGDPVLVKELLNRYGIEARLTFSNSLLRKEHLLDKKCNYLCELFNNENNGIIVASDLLLNYLNNKYDYYYVSSTTKVLNDFVLLKKELEREEFSYVVPDFRLNKDFNITSPRILLSSIGRQMNWGVFISS